METLIATYLIIIAISITVLIAGYLLRDKREEDSISIEELLEEGKEDTGKR